MRPIRNATMDTRIIKLAPSMLSAALYQRFTSRGEAAYEDRLLSAMRYGFGGHVEVPGK